jgi:rhomboid-like protein
VPAARPRFDLDHLPTPALTTMVWLNIAVFLAWQVAAEVYGAPGLRVMSNHFTVSLGGMRHLRFWTLLTSEVSQATFPHLLFNMLALYTLGRDVERIAGSRAFLGLYASGALAASLGHLAYCALATPVPALGASGAVMAIATVSALLFPRRVLLVFFILPMPALTAMGAFVLFDLWGLVSPGADSVAHAAHLAGAAWGYVWWRYRAKGHVLQRMRELGVVPRGAG